MDWKDTGIESLEEAHKLTSSWGLNPTAIERDVEHSMRYFLTDEGYMVAQKIGGGPVREKAMYEPEEVEPEELPYESEKFTLGPWVSAQYSTFEEVEGYYAETFKGREDNYELYDCRIVKYGDMYYEYCMIEGTLRGRALY